MDFINMFFIIMSLIVFVYLIVSFKTKKRTSLLLELFYICVYLFIGLISFYPDFLRIIEKTLGLYSAINFIVYLSVFIAYLLILMLYNKIENQRVEITKLVREIAYLKNEKKK